MTEKNRALKELADKDYEWGFVSDIESEVIPPGLNEDVIRLISAKKKEPEWLTEWRLDAYRQWLTMTEPTWAKIHYEPIDYQDDQLLRCAQVRRRRAEEPGRSRSRSCWRPMRSSASR